MQNLEFTARRASATDNTRWDSGTPIIAKRDSRHIIDDSLSNRRKGGGLGQPIGLFDGLPPPIIGVARNLEEYKIECTKRVGFWCTSRLQYRRLNFLNTSPKIVALAFHVTWYNLL